jgi:hypothetical protein
MGRVTLVKRAFGVELWTMVSGAVEQFAVKGSDRRARVIHSLEEAEALFAARLQTARAIRAD